jgi:hypothetical protein
LQPAKRSFACPQASVTACSRAEASLLRGIKESGGIFDS